MDSLFDTKWFPSAHCAIPPPKHSPGSSQSEPGDPGKCLSEGEVVRECSLTLNGKDGIATNVAFPVQCVTANCVLLISVSGQALDILSGGLAEQ